MSESRKNLSTQKTLVLTQLGVLSALITVMTFVPYLGYISYGGLSITLLHIPVIIGAVVLGPKVGSLLGGVWGVTCIIKAILAPPTPLEGIIFRNPIIALIPRIIVGFVAGAVFALITKNGNKKKLSEKPAKALSAMISTLLLMGACFGLAFLGKKFLFKDLVLKNPQQFYIILIVLLLVVAVAVFLLFYKKTNKNTVPAAGIATIIATITNTVLVMGGIYLFYGKDVGISSISFGGLTNFILAAFSINSVLEMIIGYILVVPISLALQKVKTRI